MPKITLNLEDTILQALKYKAFKIKLYMSGLGKNVPSSSLQEELGDIKVFVSP